MVRRFARDQWVRVHGTPRVTVLVGGARARRLWQRWVEVGELAGQLFEGPLEQALGEAAALATREAQRPVAVLADAGELAVWRAGRRDRLAALLDEGRIEIPEPRRAAEARRPGAAPAPGIDARSAAEQALFLALEATPATAGRFELNGCLSVHFGPSAAEVDLLARRDGIAVEVDGYFHFTDADAYRRDRRKDLMLQTHGLIVIRVLATDVMRDPRPAVHEVCRALAYRIGVPA